MAAKLQSMGKATDRKPSSGVSKGESLIEEIKKRQTEELVIAFCGPLGSGTSVVAKVVEQTINKYGYTVDYMKVSTLIESQSDNANLKNSSNKVEKYERIRILQDEGNRLREKFGNDILAQYAIQEISLKRRAEDRSENDHEDDIPIRSRRHVTLIDSLKHPSEVALLSKVYGNIFYLFGVLCPENIRKDRLCKNDNFKPENAISLIERDRSEGIRHGQQLLKTIFHADFFIRNINTNYSALNEPIKRFIELILGENKYTPTIDEYAMFMAQSAALRSACLSRQVGAAIVSKEGDVIATGRNDVPRFKGGLYGPEDDKNDNRCISYLNRICHSHKEKEKLIDSIKEIIKKNTKNSLSDGAINLLITEISADSRLKGLIEFSRAVHAEMDALTTVARLGGLSVRDAKLYCTTFPCHHCARHIVASGINAIYYIEPYEKSLASDLHNDSIDVESDDNICNDFKKLLIIPFEGVAPKKYLELFSFEDRKEKGAKKNIDLGSAKPKIEKLLDPHVDYEAKVVEFLKNAHKE